MNFSRSILQAAVGAAFAGMAGGALALAPSAFDPASTLELHISGASALDETLNGALARLCTPGTMTLYFQSSIQRAYFCSINPATFGVAPAFNKLVVYKSSEGGSGFGVDPLIAPGTNLAFMSLPSIAANPALCGTASTVASVTVSGDPLGIPSFQRRTCGAGSVIAAKTLPDGGISDIEPPLFNDGGNTLGFVSRNALVFAFGVSLPLYRALQGIQGLDSTSTAVDTTVSTADAGGPVAIRDNEANMPTLSKEIIAGLFGGLVFSDAIRGTSGQVLPTSPSGDSNIYIVRRVPTSGSQKSAEIFLFGGSEGRCNASAFPMLPSENAPSGTDEVAFCGGATPGGLTFAGSGTGNLRNCMQQHANNNRYAIGLLSTETSFAGGTTNQTAQNWRYIKIDGYSPSLLNVVTGKYKFWVEQSLNTPAYAVGTNQAAARTAIFDSLGSPTVTRALNGAFRQVWGAGALLSLNGPSIPAYDPGLTLTQALVQTNPVNPLTKSPTGVVNNCIPAVSNAVTQTRQ